MMKKIFLNWMVAILVVGAMTMGGCSSDHPVDLLSLSIDNYQPVEEFVDAYEAISNEQDLRSGQDYDLEKTVRVINALELAQVRSRNFDEFLDYMARQDYTGVAPDVLEAKRKLFPVLEYTYKLQEKDKQLSDAWMLVRGAARGGETLVANTSASELFRAAHGDIFAILGIVNGEDAERSTNEAFEQYEKDKKLKAKIQEDLQKLKVSYRKYLEDYTPIYKKYMQEYDALCVKKDKAYLDIYAGRVDEALAQTQDILRKYPDNAETMLLQSMTLIMKGSTKHVPDVITPIPVEGTPVTDSLSSLLPPPSSALPPSSLLPPPFSQAQSLLDRYTQMYPDRTAPALVLEGLLQQKLGNEQTAMSRFHQASVEYPRQAARLTDMLDSYNTRTYLNKTPEGQYLRRLYASTMEGYGLFSPNLLKAKYYADQGKTEQSREEIYNHFFRRGNQGIYDELLSDMQFCEENLYGPFRSLLLEQSYIDVSVEPESSWLFWHSDDVMHVTLKNRSDMDFENVRIFLCIHYTGMYKDEYDVVKVPKEVNIVNKHSTVDFDTVSISYPDKTYDDITRVRAIAMFEDRICWVDDVNYKEANALAFLRNGRRNVSEKQEQARQEYLSNYSLDPQRLQRTLREGITVLPPEEDPTVEKGWWDRFTTWFTSPDNDLRIELPRVLAMADPVFSLHPLDDEDALTPVDNDLVGTAIRLHFDYEPAYEEQLPLYIYSEAATFRIDIIYKGKDSEVVGVEIVKL